MGHFVVKYWAAFKVSALLIEEQVVPALVQLSVEQEVLEQAEAVVMASSVKQACSTPPY